MASAVTYEMVEAVCNHLAATGESPTYLKVHQHLGKGSTRIVSAHIRQWREAHALSQGAGARPAVRRMARGPAAQGPQPVRRPAGPLRRSRQRLGRHPAPTL